MLSIGLCTSLSRWTLGRGATPGDPRSRQGLHAAVVEPDVPRTPAMQETPMEMNDVDSLVKKLGEHIKVLQDKIEENNRKAMRYRKESEEFDEERALFENWLSSQMLQ
ncbi:UNVERIFIED_CONTAM: hypothetical protein PYX00_011508 [Menopon gallinae]|uniref:Uncharacterized protein n=1 Tax=Menopon gallinae TaxID=328185 RepID=A0AAW2H7R5_9NEOP